MTNGTAATTLFASRLNGFIVFEGDPVHDATGRLFYGPGNGRLFEQVVENSSLQGTGPTEYACTLIDPHHADARHQFVRKGNQVWYGGMRFDEDDIALDLSVIEVVPVPEVRVPQILVGRPTGMHICVLNDKYKPGDDKLTMYMVMPTGQTVPMQHVRMWWQDGRLLVTSMQGLLDLRPTEEVWVNAALQEIRVNRLDPDDYVVTEPGDGTITITPKSPAAS